MEKAFEGKNLLKIYLEGIKQLQNQIKQQTPSKKPFSLSEGSLFPKRESSVVRSPGFEPGSSAWQADVLNQARLRPHVFSLKKPFTLIFWSMLRRLLWSDKLSFYQIMVFSRLQSQE